MENIINRNKYILAIKIILITMIFSIQIPFIASAQYNDETADDAAGYNNSYNNTTDDAASGFRFYDSSTFDTAQSDNYSSNYNLSTNDTALSNNNSQFNPTTSDAASSFRFYDPANYNLSTNDTALSNNNSQFNPATSDTALSGDSSQFNPATSELALSNGGSEYNSVGSGVGSYYLSDSNNSSNTNNLVPNNYYGNGYSNNGYYGNGYYGGNYYSSLSPSQNSSKTNWVSPTSVPSTSTSDPYLSSSYVVASNGYYYGGGSVYYSGPNYSSYSQPTASNQVMAYTDTNPGLNSVYLSDVPSTGFDDYYGILIFISILVSWSAVLAYVFLKRKIESQTVFANTNIERIEIENVGDSVSSNLLNKIESDNSDIAKVEGYARMNRVLLSSDASIRLVKLSRLGQINVSEYIKGIATGEWIAIGENQIK